MEILNRPTKRNSEVARPSRKQHSNILFYCLVSCLAVFGAYIGYALAGNPRLVPFKLLNIMGIIYGLLGVVVLSEFVTKNDSLKNFIVHWVAGLVLWAHTIIPLGALIGAGIGNTLPSAGITSKFFSSFFAYSLLVLGFLELAVFNPKLKSFLQLGVRTQVFGIILVISGILAQLISALLDF